MSHLARLCQEGEGPADPSLLLPTVRGCVTKGLQNSWTFQFLFPPGKMTREKGHTAKGRERFLPALICSYLSLWLTSWHTANTQMDRPSFISHEHIRHYSLHHKGIYFQSHSGRNDRPSTPRHEMQIEIKLHMLLKCWFPWEANL